jgi:hypothetical protein
MSASDLRLSPLPSQAGTRQLVEKSGRLRPIRFDTSPDGLPARAQKLEGRLSQCAPLSGVLHDAAAAAAGPPAGAAWLIELEAERCSLDSLRAFTDEHYCGPAVTRCMHSDDAHSQMWVGSDSRAKLAPR